ncbi:hypothetical protein LNKW23_47960 [Paralimibaculum aggregatum]|uniref:Uncharacterized protein n=2 Tax=Paralimibaculum aggregatum TaxID=3036245 RepID=A0ABQ6LU18_9RHOB|nr:hypothetical protein LNKW23_47960 [Limibaculum sp. NKW23]
MGYQTGEFRNVFVDFAMEVLELRAIAPKDLTAVEVEPWLDRQSPDWRERLSLRIDGEAARALLSEAVSITRRSGLLTDPLCRILHRTGDGIWTPWIEVEDTSEIPAEIVEGVERDRRRLRLAPIDGLAAVVPDLLLALDRDGSGEPWACRRISARRTARFPFPLDRSADLVAMADGRYLSRIRLAGGDAVEIGAGPAFWRVAEMGEEGPRALAFAGTASLLTQDPHVWLLAAPDASPTCDGELSAEPDGVVEGGRLWRLSGQGRVFVSGGNAMVRTRADRDDREDIHAIGSLEQRVLDSRGRPVHRGIPEILHRRPGRGFRPLGARDLRHRIGRRGGWRGGLPPSGTVGIVDLAARDGENVGARVAVNIVPEDFRVTEAQPGPAGERRLHFEGLSAGMVMRVSDGDPATVDARGEADVTLPVGAASRGRLSLILASPAGMSPLQWTLDLPRALGEFEGVDNLVLRKDRDITVRELRNWRIVPAETGGTDLRIRLVGAKVDLNPVIGRSIATEQPLSAHRALLEEMLVAGGADAELRLRVISRSRQSPRLVLRYYRGETDLEDDTVMVVEGQALRFDHDLQIVAVDMDDPDRVAETDPGALSLLGQGRWFLLPRRGEVVLRPPRPFVQPAPAEAKGVDAPRRGLRIAHFAAAFRDGVAEADLFRLAKLVGVLIAHGVSPSALDQIHALREAPESAVRLLLKVAPADLEDMLSLELHGGPRWMFIAPGVWAAAFSREVEALRRTLSSNPSLTGLAENIVRGTIASRTADIVRLRPALLGHIVCGLRETDPGIMMEVASKLGGLPPGLQEPEAELLAIAEEIVRRHAGLAPWLHELEATSRPPALDRFDPDLRGLIDAPLFVAEVAFGLRAPPTIRQQMELLQAIQADIGAFEAALPIAVAWAASNNDR